MVRDQNGRIHNFWYGQDSLLMLTNGRRCLLVDVISKGTLRGWIMVLFPAFAEAAMQGRCFE